MRLGTLLDSATHKAANSVSLCNYIIYQEKRIKKNVWAVAGSAGPTRAVAGRGKQHVRGIGYDRPSATT